MRSRKRIWLASYPRSGNTYLRTVLNHCFGMKSTSIYPHDLGGNRQLERQVGHVEWNRSRVGRWRARRTKLVKTHEPPADGRAAIYVLRDGRAASVSLWHFLRRQVPLRDIILGEHMCGTWADHVTAWQPEQRANTLFLRYEDLERDLAAELPKLAEFLQREPRRTQIPSRADTASIDGKWVRPKSDWRAQLSEEDLALFEQVNGAAMARYGYS